MLKTWPLINCILSMRPRQIPWRKIWCTLSTHVILVTEPYSIRLLIKNLEIYHTRKMTKKAYRIEKCPQFSAFVFSLALTRSIDIESILIDDSTDLERRLELLLWWFSSTIMFFSMLKLTNAPVFKTWITYEHTTRMLSHMLDTIHSSVETIKYGWKAKHTNILVHQVNLRKNPKPYF